MERVKGESFNRGRRREGLSLEIKLILGVVGYVGCRESCEISPRVRE